MNEWKIRSLAGLVAGGSYVIVTSLLSLPYLIELVIGVGIAILIVALGTKLLQINEKKK